ncbi:MAG TPA: GFA family protein [Candidatus Binatia bacterium]|nr:GFA family protein [Candidatus Binatia bacterium]
MIQGSCLCRAIRYRVAAPFEEVHHCHCGMCRKAHGAAFSTFAQTTRASLAIEAGDEKLVRYRSSEHVERTFCRRCGSSLFFTFDPFPDAIWVAVGTVDGDPGMRPQGHIFVASKAPWHDILDDLPQYPEYPPQA